MSRELYVSGETYTQLNDGSLRRSTGMTKMRIKAYQERQGEEDRNALSFDHRSQYNNIYNGLLYYQAATKDFIYSYTGEIDMPLICNNSIKHKVHVPRIIFIKSNGSIGAYMANNNTVKRYPFSNAFGNRIVGETPIGHGQNSANALCLGGTLDGMFHRARMHELSGIVPRVFSSNPNNDLRQLSFVSPQALETHINRLKGSTQGISQGHLLLIAAFLEGNLNNGNYEYDRLLLLAAAITRYAPQFIDTFWNHCVFDKGEDGPQTVGLSIFAQKFRVLAV